MPTEDPLGPVLLVGDRVVALAEPLLMGVVNVNADSFSDTKRNGVAAIDEVVAQAVALVEAGARILDVGGQSAVTNEPETAAEVELGLVLPVVEAVRDAVPETLISVDSYKPAVVSKVLEAGAHIVNDVSGLQDPVLAALAVEHGAALVVMHTAAPPKVRLQDPRRYRSVVDEVRRFLEERVEVALAAGLPERSLILDPGPDFTKTPWQTVQLLRDLPALNPRDLPLLLAVSRKDFIGAINQVPPQDRLPGTLAAVAAVGTGPGCILRVHDVAEVRRFLDVLAVLDGRRDLAEDAALTDDIRYSRPR